MRAIYILWLRQLKRYLRSRARIVSSLAQPLIYMLAMGYGLSPVFKQAGMGSYIQFVTPGLIGMTILFTSMFSGIELLMDRQFGFLKETLVAPVPRVWIILGRILGGATIAMIQGTMFLAVCFVAGFRLDHWSGLPRGVPVHGADGHFIHGAGIGDWRELPGHAGVSICDQLPDHAAVSAVGRDVSADEPAESADGRHQP